MTLPETQLRQRAEEEGQGQVFRFWETLDDKGRAHLLSQLRSVDFALLGKLRKQLMQGDEQDHVPEFSPPQVFSLRDRHDQQQRVLAGFERGAERLAEGKVGFLLVAGGQASRLGYNGPKGLFGIGPVSGRSLFELHARRLLACRRRYGSRTPWYIMTSPANHAPTVSFFEEKDYFGLDPLDVLLFPQAVMPALDLEGNMLLSAPESLMLAPDGHGGVLSAFANCGAIGHARAAGVETLSFFQIDNPLARPADPLFIGLHASSEAEMSSKAVAKRDAEEKVGVLGRIDGVLGCIEYSDLPGELREATGPDGELLYRAGNIAMHLIELEFMERLTRDGLELPWHVAHKNMKVLDGLGRQAEVPGVKFETFVFDALGKAKRALTLEVERELEFSPVKNSGGVDSPASARADLCRLHASWVAAAGLVLPAPDEAGVSPVEVDPLLAETAEEFAAVAEGLQPVARENGHLYETAP